MTQQNSTKHIIAVTIRFTSQSVRRDEYDPRVVDAAQGGDCPFPCLSDMNGRVTADPLPGPPPLLPQLPSGHCAGCLPSMHGQFNDTSYDSRARPLPILYEAVHAPPQYIYRCVRLPDFTKIMLVSLGAHDRIMHAYHICREVADTV